MRTTASISTTDALRRIDAVLDRVESERTGLRHSERMALIGQARRAARRLDALLLVLVAEADAAKSTSIGAGTPTTSWLTLGSDATPQEAAGLVFAGRDVTSSPALRDAALNGNLGVRQARAVAKTAAQLPDSLSPEQHAEAERLLVSKAERLPATKIPLLLDAVVAEVAPAAVPSAEQEAARLEAQHRRAVANRGLAFTPDGDGSMLINGSLPLLDAQAVITLIDGYVERDRRARKDNREADLRSLAQRRADALIVFTTEKRALLQQLTGIDYGRTRVVPEQLAALMQAQPAPSPADQPALPTANPVQAGTPRPVGDPDPVCTTPPPHLGAELPRVLVIMDEAALHSRAEQAGILPDGTTISPGELRRLCCDAEVAPVVLGTHSEILDLGRTRRLVSQPIRQALVVRDGGCVFPGCDKPPGACEAHHVKPWWAGGTTALNNLVLLCPFHHGLVEPPRFFPIDDPHAPDRWRVVFDEHTKPALIPPERHDPTRTPLPNRSAITAARDRLQAALAVKTDKTLAAQGQVS